MSDLRLISLESIVYLIPGLSVTLCLGLPVAAAVILSTGQHVDDDESQDEDYHVGGNASSYYVDYSSFTWDYGDIIECK